MLWGEALGAALANIGAYQGYAAVADPHGSLLSWTTIEKGGIIVNAAGRRFGDESAGYSGFTPNVMAEAAPALCHLRPEHLRRCGAGGRVRRACPAWRLQGGATTAQDLAKLLGIDPASLAATMLDAQRSARGDRPTPSAGAISALVRWISAFMGVASCLDYSTRRADLAVDLDGRVLDRKGRPIPNLFAGGGAAGGLSGAAARPAMPPAMACCRPSPWAAWRGSRRQPRSGEQTHDLVAPASAQDPRHLVRRHSRRRARVWPPAFARCHRRRAWPRRVPGGSTLSQRRSDPRRSWARQHPGIELTRDAATAALLNGGLMHGLEYDDTHHRFDRARKLPCSRRPRWLRRRRLRPAAQTCSRAYILGWEVLVRMGLAAPGGFQARGFQITSVGGTLVAALQAAEICTSSTRTAGVAALGIALSQASGVFEFLSNGSSVKSMHPGWAAHAGCRRRGWRPPGSTAPKPSLEGRYGVVPSIRRRWCRSPSTNSRRCWRTLGRRWHIREAAFKFLPVLPLPAPLSSRRWSNLGAGAAADIRADQMPGGAWRRTDHLRCRGNASRPRDRPRGPLEPADRGARGASRRRRHRPCDFRAPRAERGTSILPHA